MAIAAAGQLWVAVPEVPGQETLGYRLSSTRVRVDRPEHWRNWIYQNDVVSTLNSPVESSRLFTISSAGIHPRSFRGRQNAALNAETFAYRDLVRARGSVVFGGASALSNNSLAPRVIDGDLTTYWEPSRTDGDIEGLRQWELLVDLGRLVFVDSIVVVFPSGQVGDDGFEGDPPKSFRLGANSGRRFPFPSGTNLEFTQISDDVLSADLRPRTSDGKYVQLSVTPMPLHRADFDLDGVSDVNGSFMHYIRLQITDSGFDRDTFIGAGDSAKAVYEALTPERRGAIVYRRLTAGGFLIEVSESVYFETLLSAERGTIRYFMREVPRVSEVIVWSKGDNLAVRPDLRAGGAFELGGRGSPADAVDGLGTTGWTAWTFKGHIQRGIAWLDLGATFWTDNMVVLTTRSFGAHEFLVSDGTQVKPLRLERLEDFPRLEEGLKWESIISEAQFDNLTPAVEIFSETFKPRRVRFMQIRNVPLLTGSREPGVLSELQLFGTGFPASVWLYSPSIKLTDAGGNFVRKTLPRIVWDAEAVLLEEDATSGDISERFEPLALHPEVRVELQTRTSDQTDTNFTYYEVVKIEGAEERTVISEEAYSALTFRWDVWNRWERLTVPHVSKVDDDGDGQIDEDPINFQDDDGDGLIDEDGKKLGRGRKPKTFPEMEGELALVGWSPWSESYEPTAGEHGDASRSADYEAVVTSPNPRKFIQIRAKLVSDDPRKSVRLRFIRLNLAPPLALELAGELALLSPAGQRRSIGDLEPESGDYLHPSDIDPLSSHRFSYFLRVAGPDPLDASVQRGTDELLMVTPQPSELLGVRVGTVKVQEGVSRPDTVETATAAVLTRFTQYYQREAGRFANAAGDTLSLIAAAADSLWLRFPASLNGNLRPGEHGLIEVQFESKALRQGVEFLAFVRDSQNPASVFQKADADSRDATELVSSNTVRASLVVGSNTLINDVQMMRIFTPNGDGFNEQLQGSLVLLRVLEARPLTVAFYDLSGQLRGRAELTDSASSATAHYGEIGFIWDGRDNSGALVPPGVYVCRIEISADRGSEVITRIVSVVY